MTDSFNTNRSDCRLIAIATYALICNTNIFCFLFQCCLATYLTVARQHQSVPALSASDIRESSNQTPEQQNLKGSNICRGLLALISVNLVQPPLCSKVPGVVTRANQTLSSRVHEAFARLIIIGWLDVVGVRCGCSTKLQSDRSNRSTWSHSSASAFPRSRHCLLPPIACIHPYAPVIVRCAIVSLVSDLCCHVCCIARPLSAAQAARGSHVFNKLAGSSSRRVTVLVSQAAPIVQRKFQPH